MNDGFRVLPNFFDSRVERASRTEHAWEVDRLVEYVGASIVALGAVSIVLLLSFRALNVAMFIQSLFMMFGGSVMWFFSGRKPASTADEFEWLRSAMATTVVFSVERKTKPMMLDAESLIVRYIERDPVRFAVPVLHKARKLADHIRAIPNDVYHPLWPLLHRNDQKGFDVSRPELASVARGGVLKMFWVVQVSLFPNDTRQASAREDGHLDGLDAVRFKPEPHKDTQGSINLAALDDELRKRYVARRGEVLEDVSAALDRIKSQEQPLQPEDREAANWAYLRQRESQLRFVQDTLEDVLASFKKGHHEVAKLKAAAEACCCAAAQPSDTRATAKEEKSHAI